MVDLHLVTQSSWAPELPFKRWTFSLRSGMTELWEADSPCLPLHLANNKPYFFFLKILLSLFVNCELELRPGNQFSGNTWIADTGGPLKQMPKKNLSGLVLTSKESPYLHSGRSSSHMVKTNALLLNSQGSNLCAPLTDKWCSLRLVSGSGATKPTLGFAVKIKWLNNI
jgi:hypothetical protein